MDFIVLRSRTRCARDIAPAGGLVLSLLFVLRLLRR